MNVDMMVYSEEEEDEEECDLKRSTARGHLLELLENECNLERQYSQDMLMQMLQTLHDQWLPASAVQQDQLIAHLRSCLRSDDSDSLDAVCTRLTAANCQLVRLRILMLQRDMIGDESPDQDAANDMMEAMSRINATMCYGYELLVATARIQYTRDRQHVEYTDPLTLFKAAPNIQQELSGLSGNQQLILFVLDNLAMRRYRRKGRSCYKEIHTDGGFGTNAWMPVSTIEEFIYGLIRKEHYFHQWRLMTKRDNTVKSVSDYLENCHDDEFPPIQHNRSTFAFNNCTIEFDPEGTIDEEKDAFPFRVYPYADGKRSPTQACNFIPIDIPPAAMACRDLEELPNLLPTPLFDTILNTQGLGLRTDPCDVPYRGEDGHVREWLYRLLGRLVYPVGKYDGWQVIPFLLGVAQSGKSTILDIVRHFYHPNDVAVISSNIERKFGLQNIYDKFLAICLEVTDKFALSRAEFQSAATGEMMSIARKCKDAVHAQWTTPCAFAGNQMPPWTDTGNGSVTRRLAALYFKYKPRRVDTTLKSRVIKQELGLLLFKVVACYRRAAAMESGFWDVPFQCDFIPECRKMIQRLSDSFRDFMDTTSEVKLEVGATVALTILFQAYRAWFVKETLPGPPKRERPDTYEIIFSELNIRQTADPRTGYITLIGVRC